MNAARITSIRARLRRTGWYGGAVHLFGLTGGIGSGKSTVARRIAAWGVPVLDADVLAREAVAIGSDGLAELVTAFGSDILAEDGSLDRPKMAAIVFSDPEKRRILNGITHPRVRALAVERVQQRAAEGHLLACYDVPLLFESKMADMLRPIIVVSVPPALQVERTMLRDNAARSDVEARIAAQMPLDEKVAGADYVIDNSGALAATLVAVDDAVSKIVERFANGCELYRRPVTASDV